MNRLAYLRDTLQFDLTKHVPGTRMYRIRCSQCQATAINGVAVHERGCSHDTTECAGCNNRVPANQRYCEDCR